MSSKGKILNNSNAKIFDHVKFCSFRQKKAKKSKLCMVKFITIKFKNISLGKFIEKQRKLEVSKLCKCDRL